MVANGAIILETKNAESHQVESLVAGKCKPVEVRFKFLHMDSVSLTKAVKCYTAPQRYLGWVGLCISGCMKGRVLGAMCTTFFFIPSFIDENRECDLKK